MADGVVVGWKDTLKLYLYAGLMMLSFGGVLVGPLIASTPGNSSAHAIGLTIMIVGLVGGIYFLLCLHAIDREYHEKALRKALENPKRILFHFEDVCKFIEVVITKDAIFYDGTFMNLNGAQSLRYISFEDGILCMGIYNSAGRYSSLHEYSTFPPEELYEDIKKWVDRFGLPKSRP